MILQSFISGLDDTPSAGASYFYVDLSGIPTVKDSTGTTHALGQGTVGVSGLLDAVGVFTSGTGPVFDGTNFIPDTAASPEGTPPTTFVTYSSGVSVVATVLASGFFAPGTSGKITWSGISQTCEWLEIHGVTHCVGTGGIAPFTMFFNGDTTATNYITRRMQSHPASLQQYLANIPYASMTNRNGGAAAFNYTAPVYGIIYDYATAGRRKFYSNQGVQVTMDSATAINLDWETVQWENTSGPAINMIELYDNVGGETIIFTSGTQVFLVGYKRVDIVSSGAYGPGKISNGYLVP